MTKRIVDEAIPPDLMMLSDCYDPYWEKHFFSSIISYHFDQYDIVGCFEYSLKKLIVLLISKRYHPFHDMRGYFTR